MRKVDVGPVQALAVPFPVATDEQKRGFGARSQRDRPHNRLLADDRAQAEAQNAQIVLVANSGD